MKSFTLSRYLPAMAVLCSITLCGCYTQFAATDDTPSADQQQPAFMYPPVLLPGPGYPPDPGPTYPPGCILIVGGGSHQATGNQQQVAPTRDTGHTRGEAATPAQSNTERTSVSKRGGR